jgi:protoporphyrinogen oxidase
MRPEGEGRPDAPHWGIVGGGLLGLTLAWRLARAGRRVTLLEGADRPGGLASAWRLGDVVWDRHYHVILLSDLRLRALLAELGLQDELRWSESKTGFYTAGRLHSMSSALEFLSFPPLALPEKLRLAATILRASRLRRWKPLEQVLVADWLRRWSGAATCEKIWLPLLRAKLGEGYRRTSAAFIWATIRRMYAARRTGLKRERFGYVVGGYARILGRFAEALDRAGVALELSAPARRVEAAPAGGVNVTFGEGRTATFDRVVLTVPAPLAPALCPGLTPAEAAAWGAIEYVGIVCASLLLARPLGEFYITNITEPGIPFTAVIEMSALVDRRQFGGRSLVYLPRYAAPDDPVFARPDDELRQEFLGALARMHPHFALHDVLAFRVSRARHVFALPTLGYSERLPASATSVPGVHVVSSAQIVNGTLNVNETVQLAERALPDLLAADAAGAGR